MSLSRSAVQMRGEQFFDLRGAPLAGIEAKNCEVNPRAAEKQGQACSAAHMSLSRSAVQMRGFLMPLASS